MRLQKGQIWRVPFKTSEDSSTFTKVRPYVICQEVFKGLEYVLMAPIAEDNGRLYPFQQRIYHKKSSKIHYENLRSVPVSSLKQFRGMLKKNELKIMDNCLVELLGIQTIDYTKIVDLKVEQINLDKVFVVIDYPKESRTIFFRREDFYKDCVGFANLLESSEDLAYYLSTFKGLQFLRNRGFLESVDSIWTSSPSL